MDIDALRMFIEVARKGSFAAAARDRGLDPSAVSRAVAALEASLGARLFERSTRAMVLTEAGELYLSRIPELLADFDRARDDAASLKSDPVGAVRLTASVAFGHARILPLLQAFREQFPRLTLELILSDTNLDIVAERLDLAIRLGPSYRADVIGTKLFGTRYRVVASPAFVARHPQLKAPVDLTRADCLLFSLPEFRTRWVFRSHSGEFAVPVSGHLVISNALALRSAALAGLGPALLADWLVDNELKQGTLVDLFPEFAVTATTFETAAWLLYPSRDYLPRKVRATIDFMRKHLSGRS
jgi:DNA-binding transcriptional LysR family regulator